MTAVRKKIPSPYHIKWLFALLWGGVVWLIPEHIYHGEVVLYPPFFTAGLDNIIPEVIRVGVPMTIAAITVWLVMILIATFYKKLQLHFIYLMVFGAVIMILVDKTLS
ncbi:hypothetical protein ACFL0L_01635 [Patescibacteria group bacterium]